MYLVPSRQPYIVKYGGARVRKAVSQTAKQYSLTAETGDLENRVYSHAFVVCNQHKGDEGEPSVQVRPMHNWCYVERIG
ncbi:hypothetical protein SeMB42_g02696 [Synchytrium endobioticum]|uniref:Uncharacterized protein n=1 Tax=Synchytrium endobioticum TaxID=286115 RepID=A0A507DDA7_9FUNG|nr:hypothetical protein SeMB42_g02696 [Synchytrium endobioticum]